MKSSLADLRRKKPQASCGLRDSLLDGRAGERRDDRRFRRRRPDSAALGTHPAQLLLTGLSADCAKRDRTTTTPDPALEPRQKKNY